MNKFLCLCLVLASGCATTKDTRERGPHGTVAYLVPVETSEPGARIEVNGSDAGKSPVTVKIFGDKDGTFHNFGGGPNTWDIKAYPLHPGQHVQMKSYGTGGWFQREDRIPDRIYFDLSLLPAPEK